MRVSISPVLWIWLLIALPVVAYGDTAISGSAIADAPANAQPGQHNKYDDIFEQFPKPEPQSGNPNDRIIDDMDAAGLLKLPPEKTPLDRITDKAIIGGIVGAVIVLPFALVRFVRELRAVKKVRGHLITYRARLVIAGSLAWFMLVYVIGRAFTPDWYYDTDQLNTMFFGPPAAAVIGALLWGWVKKVKPPE